MLVKITKLGQWPVYLPMGEKKLAQVISALEDGDYLEVVFSQNRELTCFDASRAGPTLSPIRPMSPHKRFYSPNQWEICVHKNAPSFPEGTFEGMVEFVLEHFPQLNEV